MSVSLYDFTVASYLQALQAVAGILEKGQSHCEENDIPLSAIASMRLADDMNPFTFQVISVAHHSMGAMKALETGEFAPPSGYGEPDYAGCRELIASAIGAVSSCDRSRVDGYTGKAVLFRVRGLELPFTAENFIASFSLPNFYFHAATVYDMLRMKGAPLGKADFLGAMRLEG